ncbi:molybdopterin-dependent oxidoreductase [Xanthomonas campestris pv. phormiicola]|nr:molybdopterin-dependent oxidoreductase [Xanthomonas campestris pv. phormiicola]UYC17300.1 molybdopterin-dependent oxidoreductase [Xanthomonas campestris pv. phormiicola]
MPRSRLFALLGLALAATQAQAAHGPAAHAGTDAAAATGTLRIALDDATLAALPRERVSAQAHGQQLDCEGVALRAVLQAQRAMPTEPLRGAQLQRRVEVAARDGYAAVFTLAELDPTLGARRVLLVDRCDGKPLAAEDGPLRLIVPQDQRPARWVRQVQSIAVVTP